MNIYWIISIIIVLTNIVLRRTNYSIRLLISLIPLFIYAALRVDFGLDYKIYESYFDGVKTIGREYDTHMEYGYYLLNKYLPNFRILLIFQSFLMCVSFFYLFKWYIPSKYAWLGFILLFINGPNTIFFILSGIRNGFAISILILSTIFIHKRKLIPFSILMFIAYLFHTSIIFIAPLTFLIVNNRTISNFYLTIWVSIILTLYLVLSTSFFIDFFDQIINNYLIRYTYYLETSREINQNAGLLAVLFSLISSIILLYIFKNKKITITENMIIKYTLVFFLSFILGSLNYRITQYFTPFFIVGTIYIIKQNNNLKLKIAYFCLVIIYSIYSLSLWLNTPNFSYKEYYSIF